MKRHGKLFEKIVDPENIELAFARARKRKAWRKAVQETEKDKDAKLAALRQSFLEGTFHTSPYRVKIIHEPKEREIFILPFYPDRIAQHAIMNIVAPLWDVMFITDSYACRTGKGQHAGSRRCMQFTRRNSWVCQFDISRFYPSINHAKLQKVIRRKIKDEKVLALFRDIIESLGGESNVPIGNYTSQWFGNLYLNELDQLLKHKYHVRDYLRYCDDFLVFGNDKEELKRLATVVENFVQERLGMRLSKNTLFPTVQGVDFLGYRHFPSGKLLVRKATARRIKRRLTALPLQLRRGKISKAQALGKIASANGWLKHANAHHLRMAVRLDELKQEVEAMP